MEAASSAHLFGKTETGLCYLLSQAPAPPAYILSMTSTHHRFIFFPFLPVFVLVSSSPAHIPYPPSCFYLFLQQGQPWIHGFFFYATWHSREIPRDTLFLPAEGTPRRGTAKKSLDLHCRKCVLAPVWNMLKPGRISWAFRW